MMPIRVATLGSPARNGALCAASAGSIASVRAVRVAAANAAAERSTTATFAQITRVRRVSHVNNVVMPRDANSAPTSEAPSAQPTMANTPAVP